ncbi:hypothetical protein ACGFZU_41005 [Streptomyces tendae]|uniref:terpene synthase family protein n=1 Tax=Streptomyces tendae TaxID=1932 RepID=UPI0037207238
MHPQEAELEEGTIAWMRQFGYIASSEDERAARDARFGTLAARAYPTGRVEAIQLASDLMAWLFLTDDANIEEPGAMGLLTQAARHILTTVRLLRDAEALPEEADQHHFAFQNIVRRLHALATPEQTDRFTSGIIEYLMAGCCEAIYLSAQRHPEITDYVTLRDSSIATRSVCFIFHELAGSYELPGPTWCRADLQDVVASATRVISNTHDLFSGLRELSRPEAMNLPIVITSQNGCTVAEAFAIVAEQTDRETHRFQDLVAGLLATRPGPSVEKYVDGLQSWIRGNHDWSLTTGRYHVDDYRTRT